MSGNPRSKQTRGPGRAGTEGSGNVPGFRRLIPVSRQNGTCHYNASARAASCSRFLELPEGDEAALRDAVATVGPVAVAIDATRPSFFLYHSGEGSGRDIGNRAGFGKLGVRSWREVGMGGSSGLFQPNP